MQEQDRFQKTISEKFKEELKELDLQTQSILIDELITVFHNRLNVFKKIQHDKEMQLKTKELIISEKLQVFDQDILQLMDELDTTWVNKWRKVVSRSEL